MMKLSHLIPFGLLEPYKPRHYREMAKVVWENRHELGFAWRILNHGVCDGCSLGPYGLKDNVTDGVHLCLSRLKLLRFNTMKGFDPEKLPKVSKLRQMSNEELNNLGRISFPLQYRKGDQKFSRISWEEAIDRISSEVQKQREHKTPERLSFFLTSKGLTNETYYVARKLASLLGTNNIDLCARLCHAASVDGLKDTLGAGAPTCSLSDIIGSDLIIIFGSNLANNQPVTTKYLHYAKKKGSKIIVVNPFQEPGLERYWIPSIPSSALFGTSLMDSFFQVSVGGDIAFVYGVLKALKKIQGFNQDFISKSTQGFSSLEKQIDQFDWTTLEEDSGVTRKDFQRFAKAYAGAKTAVIIYSMGLTQHRFGVDNVKAIVNLALARGMLGREKCGIIPIRGHSGVQGGGECGVDPHKLPGGVPIHPETIERFSKAWGYPIATSSGLRTGQILEAAHQGKISLLYNIGGNLLETMPDPKFMGEALERIPLRVHQDIMLNTSTVLEGEEIIVLPAKTRYEQEGGGTSTSTERRIRFSPEISGRRIGQTKSEWKILCEIGQKIFSNSGGPFSFENTQEIRDEMSQVMPVYKGIENLKYEGDHLQWGGKFLFQGGTFPKMPGGKARFTVMKIPDQHIPEGYVYVTTRRGKQFNSMTYGNFDPLTHRKRDDVFVNQMDAKKFNLQEGDLVSLTSEIGRMEGVCRIAPIRSKNVQVHWPEGNVLITRRYDPVSGEPDYNTLAKLEKLT